MTTATQEPEATTAPHDPEAQVIENNLADVAVTDLGLDDDIIELFKATKINSVGLFLDRTNNGETTALLKKAGFEQAQLDDILIAIADKRNELKAEATQVSKSQPPMPEPSRGQDGYSINMPAKLGRYGSSGLSCSIRATVGVAGENGKVGLRPERIHEAFCGTQLDVEIGEGEQASLSGPGSFHAVCKTAGISFSADRTEASFTMTFVMTAVDHSKLERYAKGDVTLRVNVITDEEDDQDNDSTQAANAA